MLKKLLLKNIIYTSILSLFIYIYTYITIIQNIYSIKNSLLIYITVIIFFQVLSFAYIAYVSSKETFNKYENFKRDELDKNRRTVLLNEMEKLPATYGIISFIFLLLSSFFFYGANLYKQSSLTSLETLSFFETILCSYMISMISIFITDRICQEATFKIVKRGIDISYIQKKKILGLSLKKQLIFFFVIPAVLSILISISVIIIGNIPSVKYIRAFDTKNQITRIAAILVLNFILESILIYLFFKRIDMMNNKIKSNLESMYKKEKDTSSLFNTDVSDEISYNNFLSNEMVKLLNEILAFATETGFSIVRVSNNLMEVSNKSEETAIEQSTGIKEIVATMQESNTMSQNIEDKIIIVNEMAQNTAVEVKNGYEVLKKNLETISSISSSNQETIEGIKNFNDKISSIWEVINIINSIADQTKIIAFNAELEATNAVKNGKNFKNVSNEIRRLANNTMDSTKEIKEKISSIQISSEKLSLSAYKAGKKIKQGFNSAQRLSELFDNIKNSADTNALSSSEIKQLVTQQTITFNQILETLKQISIDIEKFSTFTNTIIDTAGLLQENVDELDGIESTSEENTEEYNENKIEL